MGRRGHRGGGKNKKKRGGCGKSTSSRRAAPGDSNSLTGCDEVIKIDTETPLAFDIGTRVECPHLGSMKGHEDSPRTGTVVGHWVRLDSWPEGAIAPYCVRLDNGSRVYHTEEFFQKLEEPPLVVTFRIGSRVECKLGEAGEWFSGSVVQCHEHWTQRNFLPPYIIRYDYGRDGDFWGPADHIRASTKGDSPMKMNNMKAKEKLRFKVGDRVDCAYGSSDSAGANFVPGTVFKTWYGEEIFENCYTVPYQIRLDDGDFIFAPLDDDCCIRKSTYAPPECWICFDHEQSETNLILRDCACRGDHNGFAHVQCLVQLALSKTDMNEEPDANEPIPFFQCITCKQRFDSSSHTFSELARVFYNLTSDYDISNTWNKMATTMMGELLVQNEDYDGAIELLQERITRVRSEIGKGSGASASWKKDLVNFLVDLAAAYDATNNAEKRKEALDEALVSIETLGDSIPRQLKLSVLRGLADHECYHGNKNLALKLAEEAITIAKEESCVKDINSLMLLMLGGELNLEAGNKVRGVSQMSEALENMTRLYGKDHLNVKSARDHMLQLMKSSGIGENIH